MRFFRTTIIEPFYVSPIYLLPRMGRSSDIKLNTIIKKVVYYQFIYSTIEKFRFEVKDKVLLYQVVGGVKDIKEMRFTRFRRLSKQAKRIIIYISVGLACLLVVLLRIRSNRKHAASEDYALLLDQGHENDVIDLLTSIHQIWIHPPPIYLLFFLSHRHFQKP